MTDADTKKDQIAVRVSYNDSRYGDPIIIIIAAVNIKASNCSGLSPFILSKRLQKECQNVFFEQCDWPKSQFILTFKGSFYSDLYWQESVVGSGHVDKGASDWALSLTIDNSDDATAF